MFLLPNDDRLVVLLVVLLLAVIFGLRKADHEGKLPAILEPLRAEAGIASPASQRTIRGGGPQLYSRGGRSWVVVGGSAAGGAGGASLTVLGVGGKARPALEIQRSKEAEEMTAHMTGALQLSTGERGTGLLYATDAGQPVSGPLEGLGVETATSRLM
jgi:hypothetical protein